MEKHELLYSGKAKSIFATDDADRVVMLFRDDTSAFDGKKVESLPGKGRVNNQFNAFIMNHLVLNGIPVHFEKLLSDTESLVKRLAMIPVECVVRNIAAGSLCRRLGVNEGEILSPPVFEFFLKNDDLGDPMINESHIETFGWSSSSDLERMKSLSVDINKILQPLFNQANILLVDYKLEFGLYQGQLMLGDEFTPDGCRLWDQDTHEKMDKDRFRQGLGQVIESYEEVGKRLGVTV